MNAHRTVVHANPQLCDFMQTVAHAFKMQRKTQAPRKRERKSKRTVSHARPTVLIQTPTEK